MSGLVGKPRPLDVLRPRGARAAREGARLSNRASGSIVVSLEDFFEGVRTRPEAEALARNVRRVSGSVRIDVRRLAGPLARLGEASLAASGTFEEILLESSSLPAALDHVGPLRRERRRHSRRRTSTRGRWMRRCAISGALERLPAGRPDDRGDRGGRGRGRGDPVGMGAGVAPGGIPAGGADRAPRGPLLSRWWRRALTGRRLRRRERASSDSRPRGRRERDGRPQSHGRRRRLHRLHDLSAAGGGIRRPVRGALRRGDRREALRRSGGGAAAGSRATSGRTSRRRTSAG